MLDANGTTMLATVSVCTGTVYSDSHRLIVTRTMPVGNGGNFTPEARAIYELVLRMQQVCHLHIVYNPHS